MNRCKLIGARFAESGIVVCDVTVIRSLSEATGRREGGGESDTAREGNVTGADGVLRCQASDTDVCVRGAD